MKIIKYVFLRSQLKCTAMFLFCVTFLKILAYIESTKPREVNLALETVFEFDNKEISGDIQVINNIQNILTKVKNVLKRQSRRKFDVKETKFSDFVVKALEVLKKYDDDDLEEVFDVFGNEIHNYHYKGCKFYELTDNHALRRYMANTFNAIKKKPAKILRTELENMQKALKYDVLDGNTKKVINYINSMYNKDSILALKKFLRDLESYRIKSRRAGIDLIQMIRNGIRSAIFDPYSNQNTNTRIEIKIILNTIWEKFQNLKQIDNELTTDKYHAPNKYKDRNSLTISKVGEKLMNLDAQRVSTPASTLTTKKLNIIPIANIKKIIPTIYTTWKPKLSFITLYPEKIKIKKKKIHAIEKKLKRTTDENTMQTLCEEKIRKLKENKDYRFRDSSDNLFADHGLIIEVKRSTASDRILESREFKNNFRSVRYTSKFSPKLKNQRKHKINRSTKMKRKATSPTIRASNEGMVIEHVERNPYKPVRKSNNKDDLFQNNEPNTKGYGKFNKTVIQRIYDLEKELNYYKHKINVSSTIKPIVKDNIETNEVRNYGTLKFWAGTAKTSAETTKTNFPSKTPKTAFVTNKNEALLSVTSPKYILRNLTHSFATPYSNTVIPQSSITTKITTKSENLRRGVTEFIAENEKKDKIYKEPNMTNIVSAKTGILQNVTNTYILLDADKTQNTDNNHTDYKSHYNYVEQKIESMNNKLNNINDTFIDVNTFLNNSKVLNIDDEEKRKEIHRSIMKDMDKIFDKSMKPKAELPQLFSKNNFTDPFKDIEDVVDLL